MHVFALESDQALHENLQTSSSRARSLVLDFKVVHGRLCEDFGLKLRLCSKFCQIFDMLQATISQLNWGLSHCGSCCGPIQTPGRLVTRQLPQPVPVHGPSARFVGQRLIKVIVHKDVLGTHLFECRSLRSL